MSSDAACRILSNFLLLRAVTSAVSPSATVNSSLIRRRDIVAAVFPGCAAKRVFFFFFLYRLSRWNIEDVWKIMRRDFGKWGRKTTIVSIKRFSIEPVRSGDRSDRERSSSRGAIYRRELSAINKSGRSNFSGKRAVHVDRDFDNSPPNSFHSSLLFRLADLSNRFFESIVLLTFLDSLDE